MSDLRELARRSSSDSAFAFKTLADGFNSLTGYPRTACSDAIFAVFNLLDWHRDVTQERALKLSNLLRTPPFEDLRMADKIPLLQPEAFTRAYVDIDYDHQSGIPTRFVAQVLDCTGLFEKRPNEVVFNTVRLAYCDEDGDDRLAYSEVIGTKTATAMQTHLAMLEANSPRIGAYFAGFYHTAAKRIKEPLFFQGKRLGL